MKVAPVGSPCPPAGMLEVAIVTLFRPEEIGWSLDRKRPLSFKALLVAGLRAMCGSVPHGILFRVADGVTRACALPFRSPDIPQNLGGASSACRPVSASPWTSSSRAASRSTTAASGGRRWTTIERRALSDMPRGGPSGATGRPGGWSLLTTAGDTTFPDLAFARTISCWAASARRAGPRCTPPPTFGSASPPPGARSLNVALAASMVVSEALRQTRGGGPRKPTSTPDTPPDESR